MNLIAISIKRPVFAWMVMFSLIVFGAISLNRLGVSQMPDVDFPVISMTVNYEGASPEVVESELLDPIEQQLLSIEGIKEMRSSASLGSGRVTLEFDIERNVDVALQEVQSALGQLRLPTAVDPPVIRKQNPEESPIMFLGVVTDKPFKEVLNWVDGYLLDQFRFLPGIGEVSIGGFAQRNLRIWPDPIALKKADLTVVDLLDAIDTQHLESAAGQLTEAERELRLRYLGEASDPEEFGNIRILRRGGQIIQDKVYRIKDVAEVEDGLTDVRRIARADGKPAIALSVRKQRGSNEVELAKLVRQKIEDLQPTLPEGYELRVNVDFTAPTEAVVNTTYEKLISAAIITIVVCFFFLGSWQAALNILFSIPTSIIGTFIIIYFSGFTLNLFTLLALTLAVSIVVDDAIMLLENIVRHYRMGKSPAQAAYDGSIEILPAATAATLAVVAVFLPVVFMSGVVGKFFFQFGITMSAAVLISLLEAITITPMRAATLLSTAPKISNFEHWLDAKFSGLAKFYQGILAKVLKFPLIITLGSLGLFIASLFLIKGIKQEFVPMQDQNVIIMQAQTKPGSNLAFTDQKSKELEALLTKNKYIDRYFVSIGAGGPNNSVNQIFAPLYLKPRETRDIKHTEIMEILRKELSAVEGVRLSFRDISSRGLTSGRQNPVSFNITGPDLNVLKTKSDEIIEKLTAEKFVTELDTDFRLGLPELRIKPDRAAMAERGVAISSVARTLGASIAGTRTTGFTTDGRRYDVRVKIRDEKVKSPQDIKDIEIRNNFGNRVALTEIVNLEEKPTFQGINRSDRQRTIGIYGRNAEDKSQGQVIARARQIANEVLPDGYGFKLEGGSAGLTESFKSLTIALVLGILVAYIILAVQFNSFIHPVTILVALPFSATGALLSLWLFDVSLNLFSFIGIIVLMGIAKKNSILLVEFTNHVREAGNSDVRQSLLEACPIRLRPILLTSFATVAAAIPLILGNAIGQETRIPMGLTIAGGTIVSTLFTLLVVPALYLVLSKFENKSTTATDFKE